MPAPKPDPALQLTVETWWTKLAAQVGIPSHVSRPMTTLIWGIVSYGYQVGYQDGSQSKWGAEDQRQLTEHIQSLKARNETHQ